MLGIATGPSADFTSATRLRAGELVDAVQSWLGTRERRVAASLVVLGYSARLLGPGLAVMLRDGILLDLRPARVAYSYDPERGFRLTLTEPAGFRADPETLRRQWCADVLDDHLRMLVDGVRRDTPVATGLLWGNVASGLAGALRALAASGAVPPDQCHATGLALLAHGPLTNSGELMRENQHLRFTRRSCCLYYRLPGGGTCGDCPLG